MQVLLRAVVNAWYAPAGQRERQRLMQPVLVVVYRKESGHVVIVYEGDEVFFPGEVTGLLRERRIYLREVRVARPEDVTYGGVEREIQQRDPAAVGELVRVTVERV